eukprot:GHVP01013431.1.p3 GENE.GHVP01013431.1~~GHVP01013431.1.p3  ORF type:complete len:423 (-),score=81.38 GHVP01013431.1:1736-3004(-)
MFASQLHMKLMDEENKAEVSSTLEEKVHRETILFIPEESRVLYSAGKKLWSVDLPSEGKCEIRQAHEENATIRGVAVCDNKVFIVGDSKEITICDSSLRVQTRKKFSKALVGVSVQLLEKSKGNETFAVSVGDKFGDLFQILATFSNLCSWQFTDFFENPKAPEPESRQELDSASDSSGQAESSEILSNLVPISCHLSQLVALQLLPNGMLATGDKDEKVFLSRLPDLYHLERVCLGNRKFVSCIHQPEICQDVLLVGSGDRNVRIFRISDGREISRLTLEDMPTDMTSVYIKNSDHVYIFVLMNKSQNLFHFRLPLTFSDKPLEGSILKLKEFPLATCPKKERSIIYLTTHGEVREVLVDEGGIHEAPDCIAHAGPETHFDTDPIVIEKTNIEAESLKEKRLAKRNHGKTDVKDQPSGGEK